MNQLTTKYLKDYKPTNYLVDNIHLTFTINENNVTVKNISEYYKQQNVENVLILNGQAELNEIKLNNQVLVLNQYDLQNNILTLKNLPDKFNLEIITTVNPWQNKSCMGLYASRNNLMTQCEPEGFRKITYYQDRPDVTALFTTTIIADKNKYPILLSNGNKIKEEINGDFKTVTWHDPFKKPNYLFALVAGQFHILDDIFITKSGKNIKLEIYTDDNNLNRSKHAMESLKRAMKWDETRFNLEYDLDCYMIVATSDFNMGAMENKGLNIFNTKYVLADKDTATDTDFINVEAVIGHEYFHNWTGNRVTCRDWFQLSLKEGLTVFRDQEFTADMHDRTVKRIAEVKRLRQFQFPEDAGGLAHSVRPESYIEINNFYTMTVYEKGEEVVRMYQTILGREGFSKGLTLYLKTNDGLAATCEDFCNAMAHANNIDLSQFMLWYNQAGTPQLKINSTYDSNKKQYTINFIQSIPDTPGQTNKKPLLIPVKFGLLDKNGSEFNNIKPSTGNFIVNDDGLVLLVNQTSNQFIFNNINSEPIPSILREFSAPVKLDYQYSEFELLTLASHDNDKFNQFEALTQIFKIKIKQIYTSLLNHKEPAKLEENLIKTLRKILENNNLDPEFRALCFQIPNSSEMLTEIPNIDPKLLHLAINFLATEIGDILFDSWMELYNLNLTLNYEFEDHNKRSLKNVALSHILKSLACKLDNPHSLQLIETLILGQYYNSDNMTDTMGALLAINDIDISIRDELLQNFYDKWAGNELVMDKWFAIQALSNIISIEKLNSLMVNKAFIATNPNKIYALLRSFTLNIPKFHNSKGYEFIADKIIMIDKFNPQVASTLVHGYSNATYLGKEWKALAKESLKYILKQNNLSSDVSELASKILAGL